VRNLALRNEQIAPKAANPAAVSFSASTTWLASSNDSEWPNWNAGE
jgi:hypothetical protein